jgi:4-hydroxy-tetrahydrodipicolinate synthase
MNKIFGIVTAVLTPLNQKGQPDLERLQQHLRTLEKDGSNGILIMGTTGEGPSFSVHERKMVLEAGIQAAGKMEVIAQTGCAGLKDTICLTQHAFEAGLKAVTVLPPFFFKDAPTSGLLEYYKAILVEGIPPAGKLILYHIPQVTAVPITMPLIDRLLEYDHARIGGIKDSGGDLSYLKDLRSRFPQLAVFTGSDQYILDALREGAIGCVSGVVNVFASLAADTCRAFEEGDPQAEVKQQTLTRVWEILRHYQPYPTLLKALASLRYHDPGWISVRPPLIPMPADQLRQMIAEIARLDLPEPYGWIKQESHLFPLP